MADSRRIKKYADSIKRAVSEILEFKVTDPRKGFITVTKVKMSPDLRLASVYYTVMGGDEQKEKTALALKNSKSFIKNELKPAVASRWLPDLRFFYDDTLENALRIEMLLKKIENGSGSNEQN